MMCGSRLQSLRRRLSGIREFTTSNYSDFTGQVASSDPDVTAVTNNITYSKTDEDGVITSLNASTGVVTLSGNTGSAIVTATFEGDGSYKRASTSYTITVTEAGGGESPTLQYTLDGTDSSQGTNGYATESSITQSEIDWIAVANTTINPWRFGGKNISNENRVVYSTTAIASNITSIEVESGTATATVNSLTITVHGSDTDAASGVNAIATKSVTSGITSSTVTLTKEDETSWAGKYYRIVYNVTCGGSNQYIQFKSAKFYGYDPE